MKYNRIIFISILLFLGIMNSYAQDSYSKFREEMKKIEEQEQVYHKVIWGENTFSKTYKDSVWTELKQVREEKLEFARKSIESNRGDKRFVQVLNIYVFNFLTIEELESELKKFTPEVQKDQKSSSSADWA